MAMGCCMISRPTMNFCRLPPDRLRAAAPGPPQRTSKRSMQVLANSQAALGRRKPFFTSPVAVGRQGGVVGEAHGRHGAAARRSSGTKPGRACAAAGVQVAHRQAGHRVGGAGGFAGEGGQQLGLAVAGDAGDAEDLAARTSRRCP
jgi:hypothetical protein